MLLAQDSGLFIICASHRDPELPDASTMPLPSTLTWKTMLRPNAFADDRSRRVTSADVLRRVAAPEAVRRDGSATGIAAQAMVQCEPGAPPG